MRKCIHGKVKPCWICKHDYDRAAPYVATNWQQEAEEWKAECHRVSGELEADKSKMIDRSYADDLLAENIRLEAENARLREALTDIKDLSQFITHHSVGARIKDIASKAINPTSAGGLYDE